MLACINQTHLETQIRLTKYLLHHLHGIMMVSCLAMVPTCIKKWHALSKISLSFSKYQLALVSKRRPVNTLSAWVCDGFCLRVDVCGNGGVSLPGSLIPVRVHASRSLPPLGPLQPGDAEISCCWVTSCHSSQTFPRYSACASRPSSDGRLGSLVIRRNEDS